MESATLLYHKKNKQVWIAMCGSTKVSLPEAALRKLDGDQMRDFAFAEPRAKPRQRDAVLFCRDRDHISGWAIMPS